MSDNADNPQTDSSETLRTTTSERRKGKLIARFFITLFKCFRVCKKHKKYED